MGLRDTYQAAVKVAETVNFQGGFEEKDGKLQPSSMRIVIN